MSEIQSEERPAVLEAEVETNGSNGQEDIRQVVAQVIQSEFSGPIPPPNIIGGYEKVLPGSADRIIRMAEEQAKHRQGLEKKMIDTESRDSLLGILFAFALSVLSITAGVGIALIVPESAGAIAGSIVGVTGAGPIIAMFIKSTRSQIHAGNNSKNRMEEG